MKIKIQENIALAPLTTLKVGGAARFFIEAASEQEVLEATVFAKENNLPLFILGGGSNILISDNGFQGLVLKILLKGISYKQEKDDVILTVKAGENWDDFVAFCIEKDLQGIECLSGIPGTVGGTPVQNVGAYGQEVSETIVSVRVLNRETGEMFDMSNKDCRFAYRESVFNTTKKNKFIVLQATFCLKPNGRPKIAYRDLKNLFDEKSPNLKETRNAVLKIRAAKSMVIDEQDPNSRSAGSFFKNPIVYLEKYKEIESIAEQNDCGEVPRFPVDEKTVKVPAAWLIEKSGFYKGYKYGNAGLSTKHTLALVNLGAATTRDILDFKEYIQEKVKERFEIWLESEPIYIGENL